jgi:hypothetical protein
MRVLQRGIMIKRSAIVILAVLILPAVTPVAFAQQGDEIAVTGVIEYAAFGAGGIPAGKAGGNDTPSYGITDESTLESSYPVGYVLEGDYLGGDYSPYLGKRVTVYGTPGQQAEMRVLYVRQLEEQPQ